jgi:hypothetical protein
LCFFVLVFYRIGEVGDVYRPNDSQTFPKEFALVGFYKFDHVATAVRCIKQFENIEGIHVTADEAKPWLLDLYPKQT